MIVAALGEGVSKAKQENDHGNREIAQDPVWQRTHTSTHKFPDFLAQFRHEHLAGWVGDAGQMGLHCGERTSLNPGLNPMTGIWDFVQQSHNFMAPW
jgi:hypothetical protein